MHIVFWSKFLQTHLAIIVTLEFLLNSYKYDLALIPGYYYERPQGFVFNHVVGIFLLLKM